MGNAESKASVKLEVIVPHHCNYPRRRQLIRNIILLIKTDPNLSRLLGFKVETEATEIATVLPKNWSFEYLVAVPKKKSDAATSDPSKQDSTVTIALLTDNVFRWKVEAVVKDEDRGSTKFNEVACEALNEVVSELLTERLADVEQFQLRSQAATPSRAAAAAVAPANEALPRYEDLKQGWVET